MGEAIDGRTGAGGGRTGTSETVVRRGLVGLLRAEDVRFEMAGAGPVAARGDVSFERGGCGPVVAGGDVSFRQGGCGPVLARGNVSFEKGGCQTALAGGGLTVGHRGFVGVALAPRVTVQPGGRVLLDTKAAAALGVVAGLVAGVVLRARRR